MYKFKFFVHCSGWAAGGYENTHFAKSKAQVHEIINRWNQNNPGSVTLLSIEEISIDEFAADYIGY